MGSLKIRMGVLIAREYRGRYISSTIRGIWSQVSTDNSKTDLLRPAALVYVPSTSSCILLTCHVD